MITASVLLERILDCRGRYSFAGSIHLLDSVTHNLASRCSEEVLARGCRQVMYYNL